MQRHLVLRDLALCFGLALAAACRSSIGVGDSSTDPVSVSPEPTPEPVPTPTPEPVPTPTPEPVPTPAPADTSLVGRIIGPYLTSAETVALGVPFAGYDHQFRAADDPRWADYLCGALTIDAFDYYDRALIYFVRWRQTGDTTYRDRALRTVTAFRDGYLVPAGLPAWHEGFSSALAVQYALTGDTTSRRWVGRLGDAYHWVLGAAPADERVKAYTLRAELDAWLIKAPSVGAPSPYGLPAAGDWAAALRADLTKILATQRADGGWPGGPCGGMDHPFTAGLLMTQLSRYYDLFEPDPRILTAIKRTADYLWAADWIAASNAFKYINGICPGVNSAIEPAPILNGLIVDGFAWLYRTTGDATYRTRAIAMLTGTVNSGEALIANPKQSAQQYAAWRAVAWLAR